jgi:class 3 adenylate cyclase
MPAERVVKYAESGAVQIAYEVTGRGPLDLVLVTDSGSNLDLLRENPYVTRFVDRLGELGRVLWVDPRGVGLSDPLEQLPPLEEWVDDVRVVLDDTDAARAAVVGHGYGAQLGLLFAAVHPDRTSAVVSINGYARLRAAPDYPAGFPPGADEAALRVMEQEWGSGSALQGVNRDRAGTSPGAPDWWARVERASATPRGAVRRQRFALEIDIRDVLPAIGVPTLVIQSLDDNYIRPAHADYLVEHIPAARRVDLWGGHSPMMQPGVVDDLVDAIGGFVAGTTYRPDADRALMTVAFTDIVDSTRRAAELGDQRWRTVLEVHDAVSRREVEAARGRVVKFTGDGMMATFDGPARAVQCLRRIDRLLVSSGLRLRGGVHTGEVEVRGDDIGGLAVHIAARVSGLASAGETLVSSTVRDLVAGSGLVFEDRGEQALKGIPDRWRLFAVLDQAG